MHFHAAIGTSGVTRVRRGTSAPGRSVLGATNWGRNVTQ